MSELRNLNLEISKYAMECVDNTIKKNQSLNKPYITNYKTLVKKMPSYIQKNGLIATFSFVFSKVKKEHNEHYEVIENMIMWSKQNDKINHFNNDKLDLKKFEYREKKDIESYIQWMCALKSNEYRQVAKEMMILFGWIKRFADAMIDTKENVKGDTIKNEGEIGDDNV